MAEGEACEAEHVLSNDETETGLGLSFAAPNAL